MFIDNVYRKEMVGSDCYCAYTKCDGTIRGQINKQRYCNRIKCHVITENNVYLILNAVTAEPIALFCSAGRVV